MTMTITEIENLTAAELKSRRDQLIAEAQKAPADEVARRYVQARQDAAMRDEKMAEQGRTITALQEALTDLKAKSSQQAGEIATLLRAVDEAETMIASERTANQNLREQIQQEREEARRWRELAKARRAVLARITSEVAPLLAEE